jgi:hypothetical protein
MQSDPIWWARDMKRLRKPVRLRGRYYKPEDGLWKVETRKGVLGGFMVAFGRVTRCSPAIRRHLHVWAARNGKFVGSIEDLFQRALSESGCRPPRGLTEVIPASQADKRQRGK